MQTDRPVTVRRLHPEDWEDFRQIRLRALAEAPTAFSSTLEEALRLDEADWRGRLARRAQFIAEAGDQAVGTAGGLEEAPGAELVSMWVDPLARGTGIGDRLVVAVLEWARARGHPTIFLWVTEGNLAAERLYARHGFNRTGKSQPLNAARPSRREFGMTLPL